MASTFKRKRKRKDGSEYEVWVCEDSFDGLSKTLTGRTEKEAKAKMKAWIKEMTLYGKQLNKSKTNFKQYAMNYFETYKKNTVSRNTYRCYMVALNSHILPVFSEKELKDITKYDLQSFFNSKSNLAKDTVNHMKICLNFILESAIDDNIIRENPMRKVNITHKSEKHDVKAMSLDEQKAFIKALEGTRYRLMFLTLLYTGLRIGECSALLWSDYDGETIKVSKSYGKTYIYGEKRKAEYVVSNTKTKNIRHVPVPPFLQDELNAVKSDGLMFTTLDGGYVKQPFLFTTCARICKKANIANFSPHDLRHTYATRLLELNKSPKVVQTLLGHANINITLNTYSHVLENVKRDAVNDLVLY